MCGIFCSLSRHGHVVPDAKTKQLLQNRGPDSSGQRQVLIDPHTASQLHATFLSTVLSLRGQSIVQQPLQDAATDSILCWNGEAWSIDGEAVAGNDSIVVFEKLLAACSDAQSPDISIRAVVDVMSSIRGPHAFVFYDVPHKLVYYGRDCLGRRSLLRKSTPDDTLVLSSVFDNSDGSAWAEVEADGIYVVDLSHVSPIAPRHVPHRPAEGDSIGVSLTLPFPPMNRRFSEDSKTSTADVVQRLDASLRRSLELRTQHVREALSPELLDVGSINARVAVLFSGGLDCSILARICHDLLPLSETVDLLNVAFENPRIHSNLEPGASPYELCPDRITGRSTYEELCEVCPGRRWQFVEVNVPYTETAAHRTTVMTLMHPHNTEMDLSIAYALYFASRGNGLVCHTPSESPRPCSTTAHVLLSGLGADELFGGYQRHAVAFARQSYPGLLDELALDFNRLGKRNLGRDDRVISDSGKEVRFPYLDEDFIALALELPVITKCDFGCPQEKSSDDPTRLLEPGKRILRLLAWQLGMKRVAAEKKRAIQFGARTAKMETGKTKGTHVLS